MVFLLFYISLEYLIRTLIHFLIFDIGYVCFYMYYREIRTINTILQVSDSCFGYNSCIEYELYINIRGMSYQWLFISNKSLTVYCSVFFIDPLPIRKKSNFVNLFLRKIQKN